MTKNIGRVIVSAFLFVLLLSGCKMPASKAPETDTEEMKTTPIRIQTDPPQVTPTDSSKTTDATEEEDTTEPVSTATQEVVAVPTNTPPPTQIVAVPTVTRPAEYTLMEGEYIFCIARRFNVSPDDLLAINNLGPDDLLSTGTVLQIPQTSTWEGEGRVRIPHPTAHTVETGETIYSIACEYGDVTPEAIIAVNGLKEPYDLTVGQTLNIP